MSLGSSRPGSGDSAKSAGRMIVGAAPSPARNATIDSDRQHGAEGPSSTLGGSLGAANILQMLLPADVQEMLLQLPSDMQEQLLACGMEALRTKGTGEAIHAVRTAQRKIQMGAQDQQNQWHGLLANGASWPPPRVAAQSGEAARPGYNAGNATEYLDRKEVLRAKAKLLADMWKRSGQGTVLYTGAGLSTASGIGDYASKASKSVAPHKACASVGNRLDLQPTFAHHALAAIGAKGLVGNWVQQNHDRLAQKAGFPQARINEIHGAWGDMKNPVKMMDDSLREDLLSWLEAWAENANMCVSLGTSLCGMNADRVPRAVAERFAESSGEGLVIIGLQRTVYDDVASLRIWGLCDEVMKLVAKELGCKAPNAKVVQKGDQWVSKHPRCAYNTPVRTSKDPL